MKDAGGKITQGRIGGGGGGGAGAATPSPTQINAQSKGDIRMKDNLRVC